MPREGLFAGLTIDADLAFMPPDQTGVITLVAAFGVRLDQAGALRNGSSRRTLSLGLRKGGVYGFG